MLTFFYSTQTCSTACHIALEEAGLPFRGVEVSWKRKLNLEELSQVNPLGQVPALADGGKALSQTAAILEFIADQVPEKDLLPRAGTWERAEALKWISFIASDLQKAFGPLFLASRWTTNGEAQAEIKKAALDSIQKYLSVVDKELSGKEFILGQRFSVVDAFLFTILGWCKWSEIKVSPYSNITAYLKRIYAREAVQKVLAKEEMLDFLPN